MLRLPAYECDQCRARLCGQKYGGGMDLMFAKLVTLTSCSFLVLDLKVYKSNLVAKRCMFDSLSVSDTSFFIV